MNPLMRVKALDLSISNNIASRRKFESFGNSIDMKFIYVLLIVSKLNLDSTFVRLWNYTFVVYYFGTAKQNVDCLTEFFK